MGFSWGRLGHHQGCVILWDSALGEGSWGANFPPLPKASKTQEQSPPVLLGVSVNGLVYVRYAYCEPFHSPRLIAYILSGLYAQAQMIETLRARNRARLGTAAAASDSSAQKASPSAPAAAPSEEPEAEPADGGAAPEAAEGAPSDEEPSEESVPCDSRGEPYGPSALPYQAVRAYAVWAVPGAEDAVGIWVGVYPDVWWSLQRRLPERRLGPGTGVALRRYSTETEALCAWLDRAPAFGLTDADLRYHGA